MSWLSPAIWLWLGAVANHTIPLVYDTRGILVPFPQYIRIHEADPQSWFSIGLTQLEDIGSRGPVLHVRRIKLGSLPQTLLKRSTIQADRFIVKDVVSGTRSNVFKIEIPQNTIAFTTDLIGVAHQVHNHDRAVLSGEQSHVLRELFVRSSELRLCRFSVSRGRVRFFLRGDGDRIGLGSQVLCGFGLVDYRRLLFLQRSRDPRHGVDRARSVPASIIGNLMSEPKRRNDSGDAKGANDEHQPIVQITIRLIALLWLVAGVTALTLTAKHANDNEWQPWILCPAFGAGIVGLGVVLGQLLSISGLP